MSSQTQKITPAKHLHPSYGAPPQFLPQNGITPISQKQDFYASQFNTFLRSPRGQEEKRAVASRIMDLLVAEVERQHVPLLVVSFYGEEEVRERSWREDFLRGLLVSRNIPFVDTKQVILEDSNASGHPLPDYFLRGDGHPTPLANRAIARTIVREQCRLAANGGPAWERAKHLVCNAPG